MKDDSNKGGRQTSSADKSKRSPKESRQDRLKLALRENLKRRKSQTKGRGYVPLARSDDDERAS
jgi:hypothetical protein